MARPLPPLSVGEAASPTGLIHEPGLTSMQSDSGRTISVWMVNTDIADRPALAGDEQCDVCVVGAGIAGLTAAYEISRTGRRVLVLEDGHVGGGESGRTTAHLASYLDDDISRLERLHGEDGARLAVESHAMAIDRIESIVRREAIACDFARVDGWLWLAPGDDEDFLARELDAARRAGLAGAERVDRAPLPFDTGPALRFPRQGQMHPLAYLEGLARAVERLGGRIACGTHVSGVEGGARPTVKTDGGHTVTAADVVVCTNSPISDYVVTHLKQAPYRTFAIAVRIPAGSVPAALYWDSGDPYLYLRTARIDGDDLLIVGGEDHKTGQEDDAPLRFNRLESWVRERFLMAGDVAHRWSGQVLEPADGLAFIGPNPDGAEHVFIATGDSGMGMTHGTIAGVLLADLVAGRENRFATLYDPKRISLRAAAELAKENLNVAAQYADWVTPAGTDSVRDIAPGSGAVVRRGTHRVAVYRDDDGTLHERSAKCTHLGCVVRWNSAERSWDCPCHGSRFDAFGKVLNGPALGELGPAEA